jgi:hypothetical protein
MYVPDGDLTYKAILQCLFWMYYYLESYQPCNGIHFSILIVIMYASVKKHFIFAELFFFLPETKTVWKKTRN